MNSALARTAPCPLCGAAAAYAVIGGRHGKTFKCNTCTDFFIDEVAEEYLKNMAESNRSGLLKKLSLRAVKATSIGYRLVLRAPDSGEPSGMIAEDVPL